MPRSLEEQIADADAPNPEALFDRPPQAGPAASAKRPSKAEKRMARQAEKQTEFRATNPYRPLVAKTPGQAVTLGGLQRAEGSGAFLLGPAGSGKTFLAVALGAQMLAAGAVDRLVVCRPTVDAGEKLGFLPGDMEEKLDPWLIPIWEAIDKQVGKARRERWLRLGQLVVCSFQHMQGRTFDHSYVVLDEAQNTTPFQMETFLTRSGEGSTYVVVGDPKAQRAIPGPSGMVRALQLIRDRGLPVPVYRLTWADVVRSESARMWGMAFYEDHGPVDGVDDVPAVAGI